MGLLGNLIPGLRELRSPLAAGLLWLLGIWLIVNPSVPDKESASGIWRNVFDLADILSVLGASAAIGFGAYLLGSIWRTLATTAAAILRSRAWRGRGRNSHTTSLPRPHLGDRVVEPLSRRGSDALDGYISTGITNIDHMLRSAAGTGFLEASPQNDLFQDVAYLRDLKGSTVGASRDELERRMYGDARQEFHLVRRRLLAAKPELFSELDRLRSEAELREAIAVPLVFVAIAIATRLSAWPGQAACIGGATLVSYLLLLQARDQRREAADGLVDTLVIEIPGVTLPSLDSFRADMEATKAAMKNAEDARKVARKCVDGVLQSTSELQLRISSILRHGFLAVATGESAVQNTLFLLAQYFAWVEIAYSEAPASEPLNTLLKEELGRRLTDVNRTFASDAFATNDGQDLPYIGRYDRKAIANLMMSEVDSPSPSSPRYECLGYAAFTQKLADRDFAQWLAPLGDALRGLSQRPNSPRLIAAHDSLADLLDLLDPGEEFGGPRERLQR